MSLKTNLNILIKEKGYLSLSELESYCHKAQYKLATAERALRPSNSPNIEGVYNNKKTAIIGYRPKGSNTRQTCCSDMIIFGEHFKPCETLKEKEKVGLF